LADPTDSTQSLNLSPKVRFSQNLVFNSDLPHLHHVTVSVPVRHRKGPPSQKAEKTVPMVMYN